MATSTDRLRAAVDGWLTLRQPVTYGSFWLRLLKVSPPLVAVALVSAAVLGDAVLVAFAPVPFVFVAATFGFAIRRLEGRNAAVSVGLGVGYAVALASLNAGLLAGGASPLLPLFGVATFLAAVIGFASPTLHRCFRGSELAERARSRREEG